MGIKHVCIVKQETFADVNNHTLFGAVCSHTVESSEGKFTRNSSESPKYVKY